MSSQFDESAAKEFLFEKAKVEKESLEKERQALQKKVITILKDEFSSQDVEVFLVGSLIQQYKFTARSDVDIVLKNFKGDRFDVWTLLEERIGRNVEVILYEKCHFKDHVDQYGLKVL